MTRKVWGTVLVSILVSVILLKGQAYATGVEDRKKIVMVLNSTDLSLLKLVLRGSRIKVVHTLSLVNALALELPLDGTVEEVLASLLSLLNYARILGVSVVGIFDDPIGTVIHPILPIPPDEAPPAERYDWGLEHIGADVAHQEMPALTGAGVTVAILDTGIDPNHPEFRQTGIEGFNARPGGGTYDYGDDNGHGTHIAGIIAAAANGQGIIGIAPQARIAAVKVLDANGRGHLSDLISGLQWVSSKNYPLVNMSLGFSQDSVPLQQAIVRLAERGIIMVASAGNHSVRSATTGDGGGASEGGGAEGEEAASACLEPPAQSEGGGAEGEEAATACDASQTAVKYPARYPQVLAVTAVDYNDLVTDYSCFGLEVDVAAPGGAQASERILSTYPDGSYGYGSGTSQAAAHVTGALALLLQQRPQMSFTEIRTLLEQTATDLEDQETQRGEGLIAVERMVAAP